MTDPMDAIDQAKAVIRSHEVYMAAGDLDGVMGNMAEDVVMVAPDSPLIEGKDAIRAAYTSFIAMGHWDFGHQYSGAEVIGDCVMLHGIARGRLTPPEGEPVPLTNNFMLTLRRDDSGTLRVWRGAFAPSRE
jgi:uncharacterized protein (TIGR02246 family)